MEYRLIYGLDNRERIKKMKWNSKTVSGLVIIVMSVGDEAYRAELALNRLSKRKFKQIIRKMKCMY